MTDDTMARIGAAVETGRAGDKVGARRALAALWDEIGDSADDGDAFHRCALAHYMADVQDDPRSELAWDERALAVGLHRTPLFLPDLRSGCRVRAAGPIGVHSSARNRASNVGGESA